MKSVLVAMVCVLGLGLWVMYVHENGLSVPVKEIDYRESARLQTKTQLYVNECRKSGKKVTVVFYHDTLKNGKPHIKIGSICRNEVVHNVENGDYDG